MKQATLPDQLRCKDFKDLIRIGGKNDGGYLVSEADIVNTTLLLGLGINTDWNFEKNFLDLKEIEVRAFDASTTFSLFLKQALAEFTRFKFHKALTKPFKYLSFRIFFSGKKKFFAKYVGLNCGGIHTSLDSIISKLSERDIFIKMDIEGSEYRCLEDMISHQTKISGAVIEFHDVDLHLDRIVDFVNRFSLTLAHVHANNFAPITEKGTPLAIELTFSKYGIHSEDAPHLPHKYDEANNLKDNEIKISFHPKN